MAWVKLNIKYFIRKGFINTFLGEQSPLTDSPVFAFSLADPSLLQQSPAQYVTVFVHQL